MYRRFQNRFGTAGVIVAVVALIAALSGTALAASGALTGKQKKEVEKIAKKYAGKPGAPGAAGANGSNGKEGSQGKEGPQGKAGTNGAPGAAGKSVELEPADVFHCNELGGTMVKVAGEAGEGEEVCNGEKGEPGPPGPEGSPWTELGLLPPGQTEKGTWAFSGDAGTDRFLVPISFPIPLSVILEEEQEKQIHYQEDADFGTFCPSPSPLNPKVSKPGNLCLYRNTGFGSDSLTNATYSGIWPAMKVGDIVAEPLSGKVGRTGSILSFDSTGSAGEVAYGFGSFAVKAPCLEEEEEVEDEVSGEFFCQPEA